MLHTWWARQGTVPVFDITSGARIAVDAVTSSGHPAFRLATRSQAWSPLRPPSVVGRALLSRTRRNSVGIADAFLGIHSYVISAFLASVHGIPLDRGGPRQLYMQQSLRCISRAHSVARRAQGPWGPRGILAVH